MLGLSICVVAEFGKRPAGNKCLLKIQSSLLIL